MQAASIVYLNGAFRPRHGASLDIEDRGSLFADGVYEVLRYVNGRGVLVEEHTQRLRNSCEGIMLPPPAEVDEIERLSDELLERNGLREAKVYWQISRGAAPREHNFPRGIEPTRLALAYPLSPLDVDATPRPMRAMLHPDERWANCWIKSLMLLPNVLARQRAVEAGADEAIFHREGRLTEGASANVLVVRDGEVHTPPCDRWILAGVTRGLLLELARADGLAVHEAAVTVDELRAAGEILLCSTTLDLGAVVELDGRAIGGGRPGPVGRRLQRLMLAEIARRCGL